MPPKLDAATPTERMQIVAPAAWFLAIEEWRRAQKKIPSKSEAVRMLVERGLEAESKSKARAKQA